jgi:hypothetical protein
MNALAKKAPNTNAKSKDDGKFTFSVDSALLEELGEKLVSSVHVALTELVKNAYDADSSLVKISIVPEGTSTRIVVEDNGQGMTIDDTWAYWMRIGTGNKVDNPISQVYGRRKTGAKGVGRFACRRLGLNLELVTTAQIKARKTEDNSLRGKFQTTSIIFNWENFKRGKSVEDIVSEGSTTFSDVGITGTKLQIWGAGKNEWTKPGLDYLQRQLGILSTNMGAKRDGFKIDPGFNVHLNTSF